MKIAMTGLFVLALAGCKPTETVEAKQIRACTDDIKVGLNDPNSFELLTSKLIPLKEGGVGVMLEFTAKNKMGGRVRGTESCVFKTATSTELDPEAFQNKMRALRRDLNSLGVR